MKESWVWLPVLHKPTWCSAVPALGRQNQGDVKSRSFLKIQEVGGQLVSKKERKEMKGEGGSRSASPRGLAACNLSSHMQAHFSSPSQPGMYSLTKIHILCSLQSWEAQFDPHRLIVWNTTDKSHQQMREQ